MLTDSQAAILVYYLKDVTLSKGQQDRLIQKYWEANEEERREIARAYAYLFSTKDFVDRLLYHLDYYPHQLTNQSGSTDGNSDASVHCTTSSFPSAKLSGIPEEHGDGGTERNGSHGSVGSPVFPNRMLSHDLSSSDSSSIDTPEGASSGGSLLHLPHSPRTASGTHSPVTPSSSGSTSTFSSVMSRAATIGPSTSSSRRIVQAEMRLRTAITDQFSKLSGAGPFPISFGLARSEVERKEVVELFTSQFEHPDPTEILRLLSLPQGCNTRTRRRISGGYTWYIRSLTTGELVCAVHVMAHHLQTHHFVEMPLFATGPGYKNNGFGRLLNAALCAWCGEADFEFIMISADVNAIPFWEHLGYAPMSVKEKKSIEFYYQHECYRFKSATPMLGYCGPTGRFQSTGGREYTAQTAREELQRVLRRMTKFVVVGPLGFEE